ncbi:unnamed protein product [Symbiodinium sp. CCMP2592]|nr:unnamed protein product [Symbiodinium sp. CCMP2592]
MLPASSATGRMPREECRDNTSVFMRRSRTRSTHALLSSVPAWLLVVSRLFQGPDGSDTQLIEFAHAFLLQSFAVASEPRACPACPRSMSAAVLGLRLVGGEACQLFVCCAAAQLPGSSAAVRMLR